jgi:Putative Actinobacterial Holin-X, holin superfamily III
MEELKNNADSLTKNIADYADTYYKLTVIKATDKATSVAAGALAGFSVLLFGIFVLLFSGIALAIWLGDLLNSQALGYLLVAAFFLLVIIILVLMRKKIVFPMIRNLIIKRLYE